MSFNQSVNGFISVDDVIDFYEIRLSAPKTVKFTYTSNVDDSSYIQLWDENYVELSKEYVYAKKTDARTHVYEHTLAAGTYYIKIYPVYKSTGKYTLKYEEKIMAKSINVTGIKTVVAGKKFKLNANVLPANTSDKTVKWATSDRWKASIDSKTGEVTTRSAGVVDITVTAQDGSNTQKVIKLIILPDKLSKPNGYKKSAKKAYVSWNLVGDVFGYEVQYSTNKKFKNAKIKKTSSSKYNTNLTKLAKKKYYVRVRAYIKVGGKYYYGAWSKKLVINMKK